MHKNFVFIFSILVFVFIEVEISFAVDVDIVTNIINSFKEESDKWFNIVQSGALYLFYLCFILEVAYIGIGIALGREPMQDAIKNFVIALLSASIFLAIINNYQEWSTMIISGLYKLAGEMTTIETNSSSPFQLGLEIIQIINNQLKDVTWTKFAFILVGYISGLIILICFSFITARIVLIKCEAIIATMASFLLLGLGATKFFREYAINMIRYTISIAFKLFTMQLVIGIGFQFLKNIENMEVSFSNLAVLVGFAIVLLVISSSLPDTVASLISTAVGSGGSLLRAVSTVSNVVTAGSTGAMAVGAGISNLGKAHSVAKESGASGMLGTAKGMVQAFSGARSEAKANKGSTSIGAALGDKLTRIKDLK